MARAKAKARGKASVPGLDAGVDAPTADQQEDPGYGSNPWDRREGETDAAWKAFLLYRDMGRNRSLDRVCRAISPERAARRKRAATGHVQSWSSRWDWVKRVSAYEDWLDSVQVEERALQARLDVVAESVRLRRAREDAWRDYQQFRQAIRERFIEKGGKLKSDLRTADVKELAIALDKLGSLIERFAPKRQEGPDVAVTVNMPPDVAAQHEAFIAMLASQSSAEQG